LKHQSAHEEAARDRGGLARPTETTRRAAARRLRAVPLALAGYVGDLQPGFPAGGPVRDVYNHGWLIGDTRAIPAATKAKLDAMLEMSPQKTSTEPALEPSEPTTSGESPTPGKPDP
jgi:hypothetical protein